MADYSALLDAEKKKKEEVKPSPPSVTKTQSVNQSTNQSIDQSTDQSTKESAKKDKTITHSKQSTTRPTSQSANQSTSRLTNRPTDNKIVDRPKAFYILERRDKSLDNAVRYFQEKHNIRKADRSIVLNAILDDDELWTDESLDRLVDRLISQLTSRLTGQ